METQTNGIDIIQHQEVSGTLFPDSVGAETNAARLLRTLKPEAVRLVLDGSGQLCEEPPIIRRR